MLFYQNTKSKKYIIMLFVEFLLVNFQISHIFHQSITKQPIDIATGCFVPLWHI